MKINIAKCLLELLLERGSVTVPGLGKFDLESKSASFGEGRRSLLPPSKSFSFTEDHNPSDHSFRDYLTEVANIDKNQADKFVSKFSENVAQGLKNKKPVELAYVGVLRKNEEKGKTEFLANSMTLAKINNLLPEVQLPDPKAVGERPKMEVPVPENEPGKKVSPVKASPKSTPVEKPIAKVKATTPVSPVRPTYQEPKERGCWPWIIGALLLVALMIFGLKMCFKGDKDVYRSVEGTEVVTEDSIAKEENNAVSSGDDPEASITEDNTDLVVGAMPDDCIVIVASMQNQGNISRLKEKVRNKNYELYTESHGAYTRVGVRIDCDALPDSYENYIKTVSNDFGVNAWSLSPEFPQ